LLKLRSAFVFVLLLPVLAVAAASRPTSPAVVAFDVTRPEIREFARDVAARNGLASEDILALLAQARPQASILEAMQRPAERALAWWEYRDRFLTEQRINAGVQFWREHRVELERVAAERGVPAEYVVAILGVETVYGRSTGRYRVLDALATLSFDYPPRAAFFRKELEQFLLMARDGDVDPLETTGSYAGAMGAPQFMPSSFRNFAVDGSRNGRRDLWRDWSDVFASVANYFVEHGWRSGEPVLAESTGSNAADDPASFRLDRQDTVASLQQRGYRFDTPLHGEAAAWLVPAELADGPSWRVGFQNFYVITRYNRSTRYAMAVNDLAVAVRGRFAELAAATPAP
jgi:membrane-bound lytic murein transglycosylase B